MVNRNSPCPCGSGRRYKHCCGQSGAGPDWPPAGAPQRSITDLLQQALQQQIGGNLEEADLLYGRVLEHQPDNFDALHMRGVVAYQRGQYLRADSLIRAALRVVPDSREARFNLDLVAREFEVENEFCRNMLAHLAGYCLDGPWLPRLDQRMHFLFDPDGMRENLASCLPSLRRMSEALSDTCWWYAGKPGKPSPLPDLRPLDGEFGGGHLIVVGTHFDLPMPAIRGRFTGISLCCDAPEYCEIADRIGQLAASLDDRVALLYADSATRARCRLPGSLVLEAVAAVRADANGGGLVEIGMDGTIANPFPGFVPGT